MKVVPTIGKLSRVPLQTDSLSASVRSGNLRDDVRKHMLSESFALEDTSIRYETNKDTVVAGPFPVSKRVRFADSIPGGSLFDMCLADLQVGNMQVYSPLPVSSESVSMDVDECCMNAALVMKRAVCIIMNTKSGTPVHYRVVHDRHDRR